MKRVPSSELADFLTVVDRELKRLKSRGRIVVVGGAAIALAYGGARFLTNDIDIFVSIGDDLDEAFQEATRKSKRPVPFKFVGGIGIAPEHYESRAIRILEKLTRLAVHVPERHDLAIMKIARGTAHDLDGVDEIHAGAPLSRGVLLERFKETLPLYTGSPNEFKWAFFSALESLFPEDDNAEVRSEVEALVRQWMKRSGID